MRGRGMSEHWQVAYGYTNEEPKLIHCKDEAEADAVTLELQQTHFSGSSDWAINARRVQDGEGKRVE